jgi:hypothetical protein
VASDVDALSNDLTGIEAISQNAVFAPYPDKLEQSDSIKPSR